MGKARQWPPLLSADGKAVKVGDLLYHPDVTVSTYKEDRHCARVEVLRVTDIDLARRYVRARCSRGCERKIEFEKSCSRVPYFATVAKATAEVRCLVKEGTQELEREVAQYTRLLRAAAGVEKAIKFEPEPPA